MDAVIISRRIAKLPYAAVRRPFAFLYDRVLRRTRDAALAEHVAPAEDAATAADEARAEPGTAAGQAATTGRAEPVMARTVDVTFSLPGEVGAGNVALCGDFNDWSADNIALQRGHDGAWQVTVPLEPGSYRYRYLLDGERWENSWHAERYEPNPFGSTDSVVTIASPERVPELV